MNKTCFDCKHMTYSSASPSYSEWTPGFEGDMYCLKSHWQYDAFNDGKDSVRQKIYMALECKDFEAEE